MSLVLFKEKHPCPPPPQILKNGHDWIISLTHTNFLLLGQDCCPKSFYRDFCLSCCWTGSQNRPPALEGDRVRWMDHHAEGMICWCEISTLSTLINTIIIQHVDDATYKESSSKKSWSHSSLGVTPLLWDPTKTPWGEDKRKIRGSTSEWCYTTMWSLPNRCLTFGSFCFFFLPRLLIGEFWRENKLNKNELKNEL